MRRKLIDLKTQRTTLLEGAEALLKEGKREEYRAEMAKVAAMNDEIKDCLLYTSPSPRDS